MGLHFPWAAKFRHRMDISRIPEAVRLLSRSEFQVMARLPRHGLINLGSTSPSAATAVSPHDK